MRNLQAVGGAIGGWHLSVMLLGNFESYVPPTLMQGFIIGTVMWGLATIFVLVARR